MAGGTALCARLLNSIGCKQSETGVIMGADKWARGDLFGLQVPADTQALLEGGTDFLTKAFHASGAMSADNATLRIVQGEESFGGGTGSKMLLAVEYRYTEPALPQSLFVKFSRNFSDPMRDRSKYMMIPEVKFAALSRTPGFPITVPECVFADVHVDSGTGLIITERLRFGSDGLSPLYPKCMDYTIPDPLEHYCSILKALARLSGAHKGGALDTRFDQQFPYDKSQLVGADPMRYSGEKLQRRLSRIVEFLSKHKHLFPANITTQAFAEQFLYQVPLVLAKEAVIKDWLYSNDDLVALCHWNANIDNGWYWRDTHGELQCGLMDWGRVGQMTVAQQIYGAFSGAGTVLWNEHLDDVITLFAQEYAKNGGPELDVGELKQHVILVTATMGLAYLMDAPAIIERQLGDPGLLSGPEDVMLASHEDARVQLHMLTMFLNQWQTQNVGELVTHRFK